MANYKDSKVAVIIDGLQTKLPSGFTGPLVINGQSTTVKQILATLTAFSALVKAEADAKTQFHQTAQQVIAQRPQIRELLAGLGDWLRLQFGKGNPVLASFGVSSGKRKAATVATKSGAIEQTKATRQARHTLGKKQKLRISATPAAPAPTGGKNPAAQ